MHGGTIRAESAGEGQGATFTVTLPLTASVGSPRPQRLSTEGADRSAASSSPTPLRDVDVLVVEDEIETRDLIRLVLEGAGARVAVVGSVREAETTLERALPDVLVSDIALPGEDGHTLIKRLRLRPHDQGREIPAIAVTAHCRASDRARAISSGYQMFLHKPLDISELIGAVGFLASVRK
jgi:CheY-like chemotaxis protein